MKRVRGWHQQDTIIGQDRLWFWTKTHNVGSVGMATVYLYFFIDMDEAVDNNMLYHVIQARWSRQSVQGQSRGSPEGETGEEDGFWGMLLCQDLKSQNKLAYRKTGVVASDEEASEIGMWDPLLLPDPFVASECTIEKQAKWRQGNFRNDSQRCRIGI